MPDVNFPENKFALLFSSLQYTTENNFGNQNRGGMKEWYGAFPMNKQIWFCKIVFSFEPYYP